MSRIRATLFLALAAPLAGADVLVTTLGHNEPVRGFSVKADAQTVSVQAASGKEQHIPTGEVVEIARIPRPPALKARPFEVELVDGSRLRGELDAGSDPGKVQIRSQVLRSRLDIDLERVRVVRRISGKRVPGASRLVRIEGEDAAYRISGARVVGVVEAFTATGVKMDRGALGMSNIAFGDLAALFLDEDALPRPDALHVVARTVDGSAIVLSKDFRVNGGMLTGTTPCGVSIRVALPRLVAIGFQGKSFVHLSDLKPSRTTRKPFFPLPEGPAADATLDFLCPVRLDSSPDGRPITLMKRRYFKGIGVRPHTELTYDLQGGYTRFQVMCGIDDEVLGPGYGHGTGTGSVVFRIQVDGEQRYESPPVEGGRPPRRVHLSVRGAKTLTLVVALVPRKKMRGGVADSPELDNAIWARPLLIR